jgi:hypothetical protein
MKLLLTFVFSLFLFSFRPSTEKLEKNIGNGFYLVVEDFNARTSYKYIVESKDSVNSIIKHFFKSELELGEVQNPITIFNGDINFYIARVNIFEKPNGQKSFKHLKYPIVRVNKRKKLNPVYL